MFLGSGANRPSYRLCEPFFTPIAIRHMMLESRELTSKSGRKGL